MRCAQDEAIRLCLRLEDQNITCLITHMVCALSLEAGDLSPGPFFQGNDWAMAIMDQVQQECIAEGKGDEDTLEKMIHADSYEDRCSVQVRDLSPSPRERRWFCGERAE